MEEPVRDHGRADGASGCEAVRVVRRQVRRGRRDLAEVTEKEWEMRKPARASVDELCGSPAADGVEIHVTKLDRGMVLLAGDRRSLLFLSKLIAAQADTADESNGLQIGPKCAGSTLFASNSTLGLYIHTVKADSPLHKSTTRKPSRITTKRMKRGSARM